MKKLLLIFAIALVSCSSDDNEVTPTPPSCNCDRVAFIQNVLYNPQTGQSTTQPRTYPGGKHFFGKDCTKNGLSWIETSTTNSSGTITVWRGWEVQCR